MSIVRLSEHVRQVRAYDAEHGDGSALRRALSGAHLTPGAGPVKPASFQ